MTIFIKTCISASVGQLHCLGPFLYHTIEGIIGILINGLLVYGATAGNSTAILVWIVLAVIESVYFCLIVILYLVIPFVIPSTHILPDWFYLIYGAIYFGIFLFTILTIVVAKKARKEIKEGYKEGFGERNVQEMKNTNE